LQAAKAGPNHNALALITAFQKSTISNGTWADHDYNYMQFRRLYISTYLYGVGLK
jgi:hypothetical protein